MWYVPYYTVQATLDPKLQPMWDSSTFSTLIVVNKREQISCIYQVFRTTRSQGVYCENALPKHWQRNNGTFNDIFPRANG